MHNDSIYYKQVELLLDMLPLVNKQKCFALKGGTAINLFYQDMPRLSVDIDLTYIYVDKRDQFLKKSQDALNQLIEDIERVRKNVRINKILAKNNSISKLIINDNGVEIKIEPNHVFRGEVFVGSEKTLCQQAQSTFLRSIDIRLCSYEDVYAGKICATLDRQHPRDLFDVMLLFRTSTLTPRMKRAFLAYLISSPRPISELLSPNLLDISRIFEDEFSGMTLVPTSLNDLYEARSRLIQTINRDLSNDERVFLLSLKSGEPSWELLEDGLTLSSLPAVQWKLRNIRHMHKEKRKTAYDKLKKILEM